MMKTEIGIKDWKYYNHAAIPATAPHQTPDLSPVTSGAIWKIGGGVPLLARWTSDFDCGYETNWWYCIKDNPFSMEDVKSSRRRKIRKARKNFEVRLIEAKEYAERIAEITIMAWETYPEEYRPTADRDAIKSGVMRWGEKNQLLVFGAFDSVEKQLCGFSTIDLHEGYGVLIQQKVIPECERLYINAALVDGILQYFENELCLKAFYITDGERNIVHQTNFHNFLIENFGFRRAYCKLNLKYRFPVNVIIRVLYPFRSKIKEKEESSSFIYKISSILKMEEIAKS